LSDPSLELVKRAQKGDTEAVGELYHQHREPIFRYVRSRIFDTQVAEDLTGEVFMRMVEKLSSYRVMGIPFRVWLYRIARNLVLEHHRKTARDRNTPLGDAENLPAKSKGPSTTVDEKLTFERAIQALARLEPNQQEVVRLRFLVGLPLRDVSLVLNKTTAAVKALQHRGLAALRAELEQD